MMNKFWTAIIIISIIISFFNGNYQNLTISILESAKNAVDLILVIGGSMCLWSGIMNIAEKSGLTKLLSCLFKPLLSKIFSDYKNDENVLSAISMNITANMLGLGNAATPMGIEAMRLMREHGGNSDKPTDSMIKFVIFNTASIQIIPTTIATLRLNAGSEDPFSILPYVWICSIAGLLTGLILAFICEKFKKSR